MSFSISPLTKKFTKVFFCIATFNFAFSYGQFPLQKKFPQKSKWSSFIVWPLIFHFLQQFFLYLISQVARSVWHIPSCFFIIKFFSLRVMGFKAMYFLFILKIPRKFHENLRYIFMAISSKALNFYKNTYFSKNWL